ncbi:enoyl-CoA hydratase/isomerase family protein [Phenylobacterium sp.]|uniref:enoyl-CoA hydratase/isomerase family protein n=1 Tax=Phenylobacterium sp. TaxID=1871053 RepID=UPI002FC81E2B
MAYETITYETRGQVGLLTLNRPEKLNAISAELRRDVHAAFAEAREDDRVRVLVMTGAGRGFCSGADLTGPLPAAGTSQNDRLDEMGWVGRWARLFHDFDKPLIGAINGVCAGAGMSAALACDVRIGGPGARFKTTFAERNLSPDSGLSWFLPRIVGYAAAADLIFTSRMVEAQEALSLGLLNRLVEGDLVEAAVAYGEQMALWPPLAIRSSKRVLQHSHGAGLEEALKYESVGLGFSRRAPNDAKESLASFREKRKGVYTGT